jgi:cytidyltransferase-like protein
MTKVFVAGAFNNLRSLDVRFLQEAARLGELTVSMWSDASFRALAGHLPEFPASERQYMLESLRYVSRVVPVEAPLGRDQIPLRRELLPDLWVVPESEDTPAKRHACEAGGIGYRVIPVAQLEGFPTLAEPLPDPARKKVIVTGCFDWLHSGHIRFFEVVAGLGRLYVSLGSDSTIRELKGAGHPLQSQQERLYMVQAVRSVSQAFIASGSGYLDAAPDIAVLKPDIFAVNEDGDRPEKREFCKNYGLQYVVLRRLPKEGLPGRQSTVLRGF